MNVWLLWETRTPASWNDVHLPSGWLLNARRVPVPLVPREDELSYQPDDMDNDKALKLGIVASELQAMAKWQQRMGIHLRESVLAVGGPSTAQQTPSCRLSPTAQPLAPPSPATQP